ncbi:sirohydrochlorin chelatase [Nocardiopsis potens]|uniref:sirohydrochlorin chelatase n=1 Tax=Nocardiopsis potens TaxID=1246458 RepID=UPI000347B4CA|nr:hypothetical protein [Nocardiopsis potens]
MVPTMVLVADDKQDARRGESLRELADAVAARREAPVVSAFGSAAEVQAVLDLVDGPKVLTPAYVAGGDVASAELFSGLRSDDRAGVCATDPLGAVPSIVADLAGRLADKGWAPGDGVVLAADGGTGQAERQAVADVARMLSRRLDSPVQVGYLNSWAPTVADAVDRVRRGGRRVAIGTWRLVEDGDHERLRELGAAVTAPLWPADIVVDTLLARHRAAKARLAA